MLKSSQTPQKPHRFPKITIKIFNIHLNQLQFRAKIKSTKQNKKKNPIKFTRKQKLASYSPSVPLLPSSHQEFSSGNSILKRELSVEKCSALNFSHFHRSPFFCSLLSFYLCLREKCVYTPAARGNALFAIILLICLFNDSLARLPCCLV
jgi:hypothetical protein